MLSKGKKTLNFVEHLKSDKFGVIIKNDYLCACACARGARSEGGVLMYDFQKADMWKRISAWLFDFIVICMTIVGIAWLLSLALRYDFHYANYEASYDKYELEYGVSLDLSAEDFEKLTDEQLEVYREIDKKIQEDPQVIGTYTVLVNLVLTITALSLLLGHFAVGFMIPFFFGNGQTLGKKIFGIGVMRFDGVKISNFQLFVRSIFGKCIIETLVPVFIVMMIILGTTGIVGVAVLAALTLSQIVSVIATKARTPIHDMMASTVTMDMASQMVFESPEELLAYKQRLHEKMVNDSREQTPGN